MQNAVAILGIGLLGTFAITIFSRFGKEWLYSAIVVHLLLISLLGGKLIAVFGFTTNVGNVFFINVLFATYMLIERYGKFSNSCQGSRSPAFSPLSSARR